MRCSKRFLHNTVGFASLFRPHIHQSPCVICDSAVTAAATGFTVPAGGNNCASSITQFQGVRDAPFKRDTGVISPSPLLHASIVDSGIVEKPCDGWGATVSEQRKQGLEEWMQKKWEGSVAEQGVDNAILEKSWKAFCDPAQKVTDDDIKAVVEFLDRSCEVKFKEASKEELCTSTSQQEGQENELGLATNNEKNNSTSKDKKTEENTFLEHIKTCLTDPAEIEHQLLFQRTLVDFRSVADAIQLPFFLACGTALGAHREGYFIPHDNDIDVGMFYEELKQIKTNKEEGDIQSAVVELLSHMAMDGRFILFDICGEVEKGLELRFLHHETRIALDVNVYYPPLLDDAALLAKRGPFVWTATHYEGAASRRHGMYRYLHTPFKSNMISMPFCGITGKSNGTGFFVPPQSYLVECYGDDWRTPRKYTYAEAIQKGEYKNIIEE
ncbi:LicD family [Trypanosoma melophagium]|uniref:LicD family n=1 Tax=Trypanosoma melophagium TaxID=715481 RepID=UPI00351A12E7|nr:LicD family [Trypanosoma melophagium]